MTVSEEKAKRAYRLLGDGKRGGGLPLPPLFQAVMDELYDRGSCTVDDLVGAVEKRSGNRRESMFSTQTMGI